MRISLSLALLGVALVSALQAQAPAEDAKGQTAVTLFQRSTGLVNLNLADKKVEFDWTFYHFSKARFFGFGLEASGKAENDLASVFRTGEVVPETRFGLRGAYRLWQPNIFTDEVKYEQCVKDAASKPDYEAAVAECEQKYLNGTSSGGVWVYARAARADAEYAVVDTIPRLPPPAVQHEFVGREFGFAINGWHALGGRPFLWGLGFQKERSNSVREDELKELEIEETLRSGADSIGATRTIRKKAKSVFAGSYEEFNTYPILADLFYSFKGMRNSGIWLFGRATPRGEATGTGSGGIGLFFFRNHNPLNALGSVSAEWKTKKAGVTVNLVAKLPVPFSDR